MWVVIPSKIKPAGSRARNITARLVRKRTSCHELECCGEKPAPDAYFLSDLHPKVTRFCGVKKEHQKILSCEEGEGLYIPLVASPSFRSMTRFKHMELTAICMKWCLSAISWRPTWHSVQLEVKFLTPSLKMKVMVNRRNVQLHTIGFIWPNCTN